MERYVHTLFCEDIRQEIGGRYSIMGILGHELTAPAPMILPKLCLSIAISSPTSNPFGKVAFRLLFDEEVLLNQTIENVEEAKEKNVSPDEENNPTRILATLNLMISPFKIEKNGTLRLRINLDDGDEIKGGALRIQINPDILLNQNGITFSG